MRSIWALSASAVLGRLRGEVMIAVLVLAVTLLVLMPATIASAQAPPDAPRSSDACTATLTLTPGIVVFAGGEPVEVRASGLEPHAEYRLFAGDRVFGGGFVTAEGAVTTSILLDSLIARRVPIQVATSGRCAQTTLLVVGPIRIRCEPLVIDVPLTFGDQPLIVCMIDLN